MPTLPNSIGIKIINEFTIYIAGIGAQGSLISGFLSKQHNEVHLLLKNKKQLTSYQKKPLTLVTSKNQFTSQVQASNIELLGDKPISFLIACVKAYDVKKLLLQLRHNLTSQSIIVLIHNGFGTIDEIKADLPELRIISGISTLGSYFEKPHILHAFLQGNITLGSALGQHTQQEIDLVCATLTTASLPVVWHDNIHDKVWEKFGLNCLINLLTAVFCCKNGELRNHLSLIKALAHEVSEVIGAYAIPIQAEELYGKALDVIENTAGNYSSMYTDVQLKKRTELPYLNEKLLALASKKHIATPLTYKLVNDFYVRYPQHRML